MYNILSELPEVFKNIRGKGFVYEVPKNIFTNELKRVTGCFNEKTLAKWMSNFEKLGYIKLKNENVIELCEDVSTPDIFNNNER